MNDGRWARRRSDRQERGAAGMNVLIVRVGAMGDVLHALPAVATLRKARPEWRIDWAVDERWAPLLVNRDGRGPIVNTIYRAPVMQWGASPLSPRTIGSIRTLRKDLRAAHYDLCVDMQGTIRSAVIGRLAQAGQLAGYNDPREAAAKRLYGIRIGREGVHVVSQGLALLREATGVPLKLDATPSLLPVDEAAEAWAEQLAGEVGTRFCVMAPRAGWGAKQWSAERFGALAVELAKSGVATLVNASAPGDAVAARVVAASGGAARAVACGVAELTSLLRRAALFVGGDSGPTHLAAALEVPLVALYGPTDPARNGPWGPGVCRVLRHASSMTSHKRVAEIDHGLARIEVEEVMEAALAVLKPMSENSDMGHPYSRRSE
ncbi:MAG: glycosyl transferase [Acidobacteriota bacterium]|nr:glycosyl transferase [Acidobacteriota bacterium]